MINWKYLLSGIIILVLAYFLLFTTAGQEILTPSFSDTSNEPVGVGFYLHFIPYVILLAGIALVVRSFLDFMFSSKNHTI